MAIIDLGSGAVDDAEPIKATGGIINLDTGQFQGSESQPAPEEQSLIEAIDAGLRQIPGVPALAEIGAGAFRSVADVVDFLGTDTVNAALSLAGSDTRLPSLRESVPGAEGGFVEEGLGRDILGAAGQTIPASLAIGQALRSAAAALPATTQSLKANILRSSAGGTAAGDVALGGVSAAGGEVGEDIGGQTGQLVGSILAPLSASAGVQGVRGLLNLGRQGISALTGSLDDLSEDGAATLLAEAMVRENLSPDEVVQRLQQLGPEAIPADAGPSFSRLLRAASNKIPRIEGRASEVFGARQAGQSDRIIDAFSDASGTSGLSLSDEVARLNNSLSPTVNSLYSQARSTPAVLSRKLSQALSDPKNALGKARAAADQRLANRAVLGEPTTQIDIVDATKQELDDRIGAAVRQGESNKVRDLVRLKRFMLDEVDQLVPSYKEARDLFSGKASLESAGDLGTQFFKMKSRNLSDFMETASESERHMFRLGAKQAILDKVESLQNNSDAVKRLFGRRGDVAKLRSAFESDEAFDQFNDVMRKEAQFILTRNAAQANSTTAKQLQDVGSAQEALGAARDLMENPLSSASAFGRILQGLSSKRGSEAFTQALSDAGDILLESGMSPDKLQSMLGKGNAKAVQDALEGILVTRHSGVVAPSVRAGAASQITSQEQTQ